MARASRSGKDHKKTRTDLIRKISNRLKIKKLQDTNKRGRVTKKKKGLSNIPVQERSATVNKKATGLSNLGSGYKAAEKKLSETATKDSAKRNKAKYPKMGTYKSKGSKTESKTTSTTGKMHAIEKANRKRFGDAHVDKLKARYAEFKKKRKKK